MRQDYKAKGDRDRGNVYVGEPKTDENGSFRRTNAKKKLESTPQKTRWGMLKRATEGLGAF